MSETFPNLPQAIEDYKARTGRNQADLARELHVSRAAVTLWKQGGDPEVTLLPDILRVLQTTPWDLMGKKEIGDITKTLIANPHAVAMVRAMLVATGFMPIHAAEASVTEPSDTTKADAAVES